MRSRKSFQNALGIWKRESEKRKKPVLESKTPVESLVKKNLKPGEAILSKVRKTEEGSFVFLKMRSDGKIVKVILPADGSSVVELKNWELKQH